MKKLSAFVMVLVLVAAMSLPVFASGAVSASVDTSGSTAYYNPGDTVNVVLSLCDISFGDADGASAFEFSLVYDKYKVTPVVDASVDADGDQGDFTSLISQSPDGWEGFGILDVTKHKYDLAFSDNSGAGTVTADGELVITVPFTVKSDVGTNDIVFEFESVAAYNSNMEVYCELSLDDVVISYSAQPTEKVSLPDGAVALDIAGYKHDVNNVIFYSSSDAIVRDYVCTYMSAAANQEKLSNFGIIIVDSEGVITYCDTTVGDNSDKSEVEIPAGSYIIGVHADSADFAAFAESAAVGSVVTLYNVNIEATGNPAARELTSAGFVIGLEDVPVVTDPLALKDGVNAVYTDEGATLILGESELSLEAFENLFKNPDFEVYGKNGSLVTTGYVGTNAIVVAGDVTVTVVLLGDVNGDGRVAATDYLLLKRTVFGAYTPSGAALKACCIRGKDEPNSMDYLILKRIVIGATELPVMFQQYWT